MLSQAFRNPEGLSDSFINYFAVHQGAVKARGQGNDRIHTGLHWVICSIFNR